MLEWWYGGGLKILWPLRLCGFKFLFEYENKALITSGLQSLFFFMKELTKSICKYANKYISLRD